jgi:uncharacterized protein with GYD domain
MLFSFTADYTAQSVNAMRENPNTNRREVLNQLLEAAGGKLVSFYHTIENGPGAQVTFDVPDGSVAAAITGVAVAAGAVHHAHLTRLYTTEEVSAIQQKANQIRSAYKAPGQQ